MYSTSNDDLVLRVAKLERRLDAATRRARRAVAAAALAIAGALVWSASPEARAQFGLTLANLNARLTAVEAKTQPITVAGTDLTISGVNVHVIDGGGSTLSASGLGNLTIGYNSLRGGGDARGGAHNLILGDANNYISSGGLVAGVGNQISGGYATVGGGFSNTASGDYASVSGGVNNVASGTVASVSGGWGNTASGYAASVSGGADNVAGGTEASVSGGDANIANGIFASVSGGYANMAGGIFASVSGGATRSAPGDANWAAGQYFSPN